jgi:DNA-binding MarR family transcriptional regulator
MAAGLRRRGDYEVLTLLRRSEPDLLAPVDVANRLRGSASGLTGKVNRLESLGLLSRVPDPDDRRAVRLQLSGEGRSLAEDAFSQSVNVYQAIFEDLRESDHAALTEILEKVLNRLDQLVESRGP